MATHDHVLLDIHHHVTRAFQGLQNCADRWDRHSRRGFSHAQMVLNHYVELDIILEPGQAHQWGILSQHEGIADRVASKINAEIESDIHAINSILELLSQVYDAMQAHIGIVSGHVNSHIENGHDEPILSTLSSDRCIDLAHEIVLQYKNELAAKKAIVEDLQSCNGHRERGLVYLSAWLMEPCLNKERISEIMAIISTES